MSGVVEIAGRRWTIQRTIRAQPPGGDRTGTRARADLPGKFVGEAMVQTTDGRHLVDATAGGQVVITVAVAPIVQDLRARVTELRTPREITVRVRGRVRFSIFTEFCESDDRNGSQGVPSSSEQTAPAGWRSVSNDHQQQLGRLPRCVCRRCRSSRGRSRGTTGCAVGSAWAVAPRRSARPSALGWETRARPRRPRPRS